jgi:regulator of protease activity HflC (stomatin/prohibitin superfamily)
LVPPDGYAGTAEADASLYSTISKITPMFLIQFLNVATIAAWVILLAIALSLVAQRARRDGLLAAFGSLVHWRTALLLLLAFVITFLARSLIFIPPDQVGVVVSIVSPNGYRDQPLRSGLHWIPPLLEEVYQYSIAWQTYTMSHTPQEGNRVGDDSITARTSDGQQVSVDSSTIYQIIPEQSIRIHIEWRQRYQEDFIRTIVRGTVRSVISNYTVGEVNSDKRQDVELQINDALRAALLDKGFALDRFVLRNLAFSAEFMAAIESKQVALEGVTRSQYEAEQVRELAQGSADQIRFLAQAEAEAILLKAEAEAEALRLLAEALKLNPDLLSYRYIDKIAPNIRVMLLPSDSPYILPLNEIDLSEGTSPMSETTALTATTTLTTTTVPNRSPTPTPIP